MVRRSTRMRALAVWLLGLCVWAATHTAQAAGFRSVSEAAILYDAPSAKGKRLYIAPVGMPVQVIVLLDAWVKVRDASGELSWIERKSLDEKQMLVTLASTTVRIAPNDYAADLFPIDKGVLLELIEAPATPTSVPPRTASNTPDGWAKVRHADGQSGYIKVTEVWGL